MWKRRPPGSAAPKVKPALHAVLARTVGRRKQSACPTLGLGGEGAFACQPSFIQRLHHHWLGILPPPHIEAKGDANSSSQMAVRAGSAHQPQYLSGGVNGLGTSPGMGSLLSLSRQPQMGPTARVLIQFVDWPMFLFAIVPEPHVGPTWEYILDTAGKCDSPDPCPPRPTYFP